VRLYLEKKPITKIGLVEWLKVKSLSSNPSTAKQKEYFPFVISIAYTIGYYITIMAFFDILYIRKTAHIW
jgi:hypothetical protein